MITYPVNITTDRFTFKLNGNTRRGCIWPRGDGMQLQDADPALVILKESVGLQPAYDPATQRLTAVWVDDDANQSAVWTYSVAALSQAEQDAYAVEVALGVKRADLLNSITTLRDWAGQAAATTVTSGNAVATLQTVVTRLGVFFDKFADLLEVKTL